MIIKRIGYNKYREYIKYFLLILILGESWLVGKLEVELFFLLNIYNLAKNS